MLLIQRGFIEYDTAIPLKKLIKGSPNSKLIFKEFKFLGGLMTEKHHKKAYEEDLTKNRYRGIVCYEDTRVKLNINPEFHQEDYINACYVDVRTLNLQHLFRDRNLIIKS